MKVKDFLKQLKKELQPYKEFDIDNDWSKEVKGKDLSSALEESVVRTDLQIKYWWDYDD